MEKEGKTLIICTEGASYRNFINSGVVDEIIKQTKVILVCADWMLPFLKKKFKNISSISFETVYKPSKNELLLDHLRMTRTIYPPVAYSEIKTTSLKIKRDREIKKAPLRYFSRAVAASIAKPKIMQSLFRNMSWIWKKEPVVNVFKKHNITKVFSTNILALDHLPYVEYAMKNKIHVLSFIGSWDNLTSKGIPMYVPDILMVWAPKQIEECIKLVHLPKKILKVVGAPQFDSYFKNEIPSKKELFEKLKIPEHSRVISYIGGIPQNVMGLTSENEKVIVDTILKGIDERKLPQDIIIVIRPHPGVKDWKQYERFEKHKHVRMNYPAWYLAGKEPPKSWNPNWEDHLFMGSLMKYSSVAVTPGGSSTLDASCFDTPSVNIYFDNPPRSYLESLKSHCDFDHLRYIRDYKASPFVKSPEELLKELNDGLNNPKKYSAGRKLLVKMLVGPTDGKSAERTAKEVLNCCG